jgi:hypothetical protein
MSKKIVIMPVFCDTHLIKFQIDNIVETINPDYIIYNEGLFPKGPESSTNINNDFISKYTLDGHRGFDFAELEEVIHNGKKKYPNINFILNKMNYEDNVTSASHNAMTAYSNFKDLGVDVKEGDFIFPFEGDVFHHESSVNEIEGYMKQLKPNTGFKSIWIDFIETQFYTEKNNWQPVGGNPKQRKICICYGDLEFYKDVVLNFESQNYPMLFPTDLITYHYAWWRPDKYKQLRFDQLNRHSGYWNNWDKGLSEIRNNTKNDVAIRPHLDGNQLMRYATYVEFDQPKHVKDHSNFLKINDR